MPLKTTQESWNVLAGTEGLDEQEVLATLADAGELIVGAVAVEEAIAAKTEIAALTGASNAAAIVAALQA